MALHNYWDRFLPTLNGNVMTDGGSLNLAKGQLGIFKVKEGTKDGLPAVSNFAGLPLNTELQIRVGNSDKAVLRTQGNKDKHTRTFKIQDITSLTVHAPDAVEKVDDIIVGYDGINDSTALDFGAFVPNCDNCEGADAAENYTLQVDLKDGAIPVLGQKNHASFRMFFTKESEDQTNQEIVEKAVENAKNDWFVGSVPITEFIDILVVNSENTGLSGQNHRYSTLTVIDDGTSNALAEVQAQTDYKVVRTGRNGQYSEYTILVPKGSSTYPSVAAFQPLRGGLVKGCAACPSGFTAEDGGYVYVVNVADNGEDVASGIETFLDAEKVEKQGNNGGTGIYLVVVADKLTADDIEEFGTPADEGGEDWQATATVEYVGLTADICNPDSQPSTTAWVAGDECTAVTEDYFLQIASDDCDGHRLEEVQAAYPDLVITREQADDAACQNVYKTSVTTNIVCPECDDIFRDLLTSEAPENFGPNQWIKEETTYSDSAKMGIRFRGKRAKLNPNEYLRDEVPFINSSVKINVAGGYYSNVFYGFKEGGKPFHVKVLSRAADLANLGGNLWAKEDRDNVYFNGHGRHKDNFAKFLLGEESVLKPDAQYVIYNLRVNIPTKSQSFGNMIVEPFNYEIAAEVGVHQRVEDLLNALAGKAGVQTVQAFGGQ